jgi:low temperature requirement protein LtrA
VERVAPGERPYGGGWGVTAEAQTGPVEPEDQRVTSLELFFDLVLVFAITQVTGFISADPTWTRLVEGLAILAALWWAWVSYAWLANTAACCSRRWGRSW